MKEEIDILGFLDNSKEKQQTGYEGYPCFALDQAAADDETGIILTISQFARPTAMENLKALQLKKDVDFFLFEEFLSVYYLYRCDKVYMSSISFLPSTICNLKCRHCLNFNPFAKTFYKRDFHALKQDLDLFFEKVDRIMIFHLSGGEPFLYPQIGDLIQYIDKNYGYRIDNFRTVTNGTIVPSKQLLQQLADANVEVTIDDYRHAVPQFDDNFKELIDRFNRYQVKYIINRADKWVDLAPENTDYSKMCDMWLAYHYDQCCQTWQELRDGKLFYCNYAAYAAVAGLVEETKEETFDLRKCGMGQKKQLIEFRLGYSEKGYTEFCKRCRGFTAKNTKEVEPAIQM